MSKSLKVSNARKGKGKQQMLPAEMTMQAPSAVYRPTGVLMGFPRERATVLAYSDLVQIGSASGAFNKYQFRLTSLFDPDFTSTGHQPLAFDQWALFYNHYVVDSVVYEITVTPVGGGINFGVYTSDDTTNFTNVPDMVEHGATVSQLTGYSEPKVVRGSFKTKEFFNRTGDINNDGTLSALVTANPAETAFLNVYSQSTDGSASTVAYTVIKLEFHCRFSEPKDLAAS